MAHHWVAGIAHLCGGREGVDTGNDGAAFEHILIEFELGLRGDVGGVKKQDDVVFLWVDRLGSHCQVFEFVGLLKLVVDDPRLATGLAGCGWWAAGDREGGHETDNRLAGGADLGDGA